MIKKYDKNRVAAEFGGTLPREPLEHSREMSRILESEVICYEADILVRYRQTVLGHICHLLHYHCLGRQAGLLLDKLAKIFGREAKTVGKNIDRRELAPVVGRVEILSQHPLELGHNLGVDLMACDELTVIESVEIFKQELDIGRDDRGRMTVDGMVELAVYL